MHNYRTVWVKNMTGRRNIKYRVSEKVVYLVCWRNSKQPCDQSRVNKSNSGGRVRSERERMQNKNINGPIGH